MNDAPSQDLLNEEDQLLLNKVAADAIRHGIQERREPSAEWEAIAGDRDRLLQSRGVFVTIYVGGQLRGCLGELEPTDGLAAATARCAAHATYADGRFQPVRQRETARVTFKISVMTPLRPLASIDAIVIGRDGLLVRNGNRMGLLLPDVPVEYGWDVAMYLKQLWRKAGLAPDVPVGDVTLHVFQTQIIEGDLAHAGDDSATSV